MFRMDQHSIYLNIVLFLYVDFVHQIDLINARTRAVFFLQSQEVPSSRQDTTQGFLFDPRTLEPNINGPAFAEAIKHMRTMWQAGKARAGGNLQKEGCCVRENGAYRQQALYHQLVANPIIIWEMDFNGF